MLTQEYSNGGLASIYDDARESYATLATGTYRAGQILAQRAGETVQRPYDPENDDGSEIPISILVYATAVGADGNHFRGGQASSEHRTQGDSSVPVFRETGTFRQADLVGLDENCIGKLFRLMSGSIAAGDAVVKLL